MTLPTLTPDERATLAAPILTLSQYAARLRRHAADHPDDHERAIGLALVVETALARMHLTCDILAIERPT